MSSFCSFYFLCSLRFCQGCLQACLRPQKPVCAVCRTGLGQWTKAANLEALIQSSVASCKGCGTQVRPYQFCQEVTCIPFMPNLGLSIYCKIRPDNRCVLTPNSGWPLSDEKPHSCLFKISGIHRRGSEDFRPESASYYQVNFIQILYGLSSEFLLIRTHPDKPTDLSDMLKTVL